MSQMCPNCSFDNPDEAKTCSNCPSPLYGLLGQQAVLSDRYQVVSVLGFGAMGAVYLAEDQRLAGRRCAIKENRPNADDGPEVLARLREQFLAEARVLARLDHPGLPKVSDYFVTANNNREYLVMDYVEGEDLNSMLQRAQQPLPEESVLDWADQVLDALTYLHNQRPQPIVHRDIKPANMRLNLQGRVKLVDFGLVKLFDASSPETKVELRGLGTPAYAPLEQFASSEEHTDPRSDIYALGASLYHLLTNLYPPDVHQRLLRPEVLVPPRQLNPQISENTELVILRAMEIHPNQRYQAAAEMRQALKDQAPVGAKAPAKPAEISPWWLAAVGLVIVLLILVGAAWFLFGPFGPQTPTPAPVVMAEEKSMGTPVEALLPAATTAPPTSTPTLVVQTIVPLGDAAGAQDTIIETDTPTPEPSATPTLTPTTITEIVQPQGIPAASLVGTIAYPVFNGTDYDLYLGQADGSGTQFFRAHSSQPAFSPDGNRIAFHSWQLDARGLMTMDVSGANLKQTTNFIEDQLPSWSPDGSQLVLLSRRSGDRRSQLIRMGSFEELGQGVIIGEGEYPTLGPNGQLVFKGWGNTPVGLHLASLAFDNLQPVTDTDKDTAPALSPDGSKIAFMSNRDENWEIYLVNSDGSGLQRLTDDPANDGLPAWSPDGQVLAFVSDRGGAWAVWAMRPNGQDQRQLFSIEGSPDGLIGTDVYASRGWTEERISWKR
ncbi:MAG: PD40 domain-containing protein [Anaerolineae bacterium]|nr:PD40 domain-containing protein [Anaerolineae bacterium]